jgi:hypothetical protein
MTTALVRCRGCSIEYTPQGLSVHVSKTRDPRCQHAPMAPRVLAASSSIHRFAMPPSLNPIQTPPFSGENALGDQNDIVDGIQTISDGAFVIARVVCASSYCVSDVCTQRR